MWFFFSNWSPGSLVFNAKNGGAFWIFHKEISLIEYRHLQLQGICFGRLLFELLYKIYKSPENVPYTIKKVWRSSFWKIWNYNFSIITAGDIEFLRRHAKSVKQVGSLEEWSLTNQVWISWLIFERPLQIYCL